MRGAVPAAVVIAAGLWPAAATAQETWLLVVSGVGGNASYRQTFVDRSIQLLEAAQERFGIPASHITYLAERIELADGRAAARSTREEVDAAITDIAARCNPGDQVLIVLIGHGSTQGEGGRFALPGPDMGPADFAPLLGRLSQQRVGFVNTASASGGFLALAGPGRVVVTATRAGQREEPLFGQFFVEAFSAEGADTDKDQGVSLLESFVYARTEVARAYDLEGTLRTENALLDDDGDGKGTETPEASDGDGALARRFVLGGVYGSARLAGVADDAELRSMLEKRGEHQAAFDHLRAAKAELAEDDYLTQLEELLVQIAELDTAIRARNEAAQ